MALRCSMCLPQAAAVTVAYRGAGNGRMGFLGSACIACARAVLCSACALPSSEWPHPANPVQLCAMLVPRVKCAATAALAMTTTAIPPLPSCAASPVSARQCMGMREAGQWKGGEGATLPSSRLHRSCTARASEHNPARAPCATLCNPGPGRRRQGRLRQLLLRHLQRRRGRLLHQ